jgi:hypothetical protein
MVSRANDDFGQAEPARFAANAFAANGSPVYLYMFSYVPTAMREQLRAGSPHGGDVPFAFGTLGGGRGGAPTPRTWRSRGSRKAIGSTSPGLAIRTDRDCQPGRATSPAKIKSSLSGPMVPRVLGRTSARRGWT